MIHLKLFIQKNEYEIILFFWDNKIGPDGCRALNESLPSLAQLQTLNLSRNNLLLFFWKHFSLWMFYFFASWIRNKMALFMKTKIKCFISHEFQNFTMIHLKLFIQKNEYEIILFFWGNNLTHDDQKLISNTLPEFENTENGCRWRKIWKEMNVMIDSITYQSSIQ